MKGQGFTVVTDTQEYADNLLEKVRSQVRCLDAEVMGIKTERASYPDMLGYLHTLSDLLETAPSVYDVTSEN